MAKQNKGKKDKKKDRRPPQDDAATTSNEPAEDYDESGRFDSTKPQFRRPKEETAKVVLDERFTSVLTDSRFQLDVQDKYGRKKKKKEAKDELSAFYTIEDGDDATKKEGKDEDGTEKKESSDDESESDDESADGEEKDEEDTDPRSRIAYLTALSRGEVEADSSSNEEDGDDQSQSSASDDDDESNGEEDPVYGLAGVLDPSTKEEEIVLTEEESPYLAVLNMDWSHVRAVDIFAMITSFTPAGSVKKVQVYPSDFGMEQLAKEERLGPSGLWKKKKTDPDEEGKSDDDSSSSSKGSEDDDDDGVDGKAKTEDSAPDGDEEEEYDDEEEVKEALRGAGGLNIHQDDNKESDFDPEKLRAYEASKLKYYFAIVELASPHHADVAYREVDGLEFEHSGSAMDLRSIPPSGLADVVKNRQLRDEASGLPSNYVPPSFVVTALQQTNVQCTWEMGDHDREKTLTKYTSGEAWEALAEGDDLKAYLASDASSDEEDEEDNEDNERVQKGSKMRMMLGLESGSDSDSDEEDGPAGLKGKGGDSTEEESSSDEEAGKNEDEGDVDKEVKFLPGKVALEDKIRSKLDAKDAPKEKELTPWEKYQEKRKEKRRGKRSEAREKRKEINDIRKGGKEAKKPARKEPRDSFFLDGDGNGSDDNIAPEPDVHSAKDEKSKKSKEQLELLAAGDDDAEEALDYDMRGLQRIAKNKDKKLRGSRKRKEAAVVASVSGADFKVNVGDKRFAAVLEGSDDRFGIDRTDPNFKETSAMKDILAEQSRQRKAKRRKTSKGEKAVPDISAERLGADAAGPTAGSSALSSLVQSLKAKVAKA
jgi:hypothetical protein